VGDYLSWDGKAERRGRGKDGDVEELMTIYMDCALMRWIKSWLAVTKYHDSAKHGIMSRRRKESLLCVD
jgi:hypothetical protein